MLNTETLLRVSMYFRKNPEVTDEYFRNHWATTHADMCKPWMQKHGILKYTQNHINKNLNESLTKAIPFASIVEYDGVADFYVRKLDDWTRAVMEDKYYMDELVPDALIFGDFAGARVTVGEEYVVIDDGRIIQEHVHQYERPSHAPGLSQEPPSQTVG